METCMLAQAERLELEHGQSLRLLSALEVLQARREAAGLAQEDKEQALCANACLLAKALERDGAPVFENGGDALARLTVGEIAALSGQWWEFNRTVNPSPSMPEEELEGMWWMNADRVLREALV